MAAKKRLKIGTSTEARRAANRVANLVLNGEIDPKTENTILYSINVILSAIRVDEQQARIEALEMQLEALEDGEKL